MNFIPIDNRQGVECFYIIKNCDKKTSSKGDCYLDLTLADKSGEINAKIWNYSEREYGEYAVDDLVKVRGSVSEYKGAQQLRVDRIRPVIESDGVQITDFVASSEYSGEKMFDELMDIASGFENSDLKTIVTSLLAENRDKLLYWPAAYKLHHAIRSGLLMHTLSIVRLCDGVCNVYPSVDRELLVSGAILHDIAKTTEFVLSNTGTALGYSTKGNLIGHLAEGAIMIREAAKKNGCSEDTALLLEHMVLSHHGTPEFGACVRPMFLEAVLLSQLDMMDATVYEVNEAVEQTKPLDFSARLWALDNRKIYNHNRKKADNVKLF